MTLFNHRGAAGKLMYLKMASSKIRAIPRASDTLDPEFGSTSCRYTSSLEGRLRVTTGPSAALLTSSAVESQADEIEAKADIAPRRSAVEGKADVPAAWS
jgi:hypothetical protein